MISGPRHTPDAGRTPDSEVNQTDATVTGSDASNALTPTTFLTGWEKNVCTAAFACKANYPNNTGQTFTQAFGNTVTDCYSIESSYDMPASVESEVASGQIKFDPTSAATCLAGITYACNTFWQSGLTTPNACQFALVGSVPNGGQCLDDWQCAWTSYCNQQSRTCTAGN